MKHGLSKTPEYQVWKTIRSRCHNVKDKDYKYYGARGIIMCEEWRNALINNRNRRVVKMCYPYAETIRLLNKSKLFTNRDLSNIYKTTLNTIKDIIGNRIWVEENGVIINIEN